MWMIAIFYCFCINKALLRWTRRVIRCWRPTSTLDYRLPLYSLPTSTLASSNFHSSPFLTFIHVASAFSLFHIRVHNCPRRRGRKKAREADIRAFRMRVRACVKDHVSHNRAPKLDVRSMFSHPWVAEQLGGHNDRESVVYSGLCRADIISLCQ